MSLTYTIEQTSSGFWDVTVRGSAGATWGLNGGEPCLTLDELEMFLDELEAMTRERSANALPQDAIDDLRRQLEGLRQL